MDYNAFEALLEDLDDADDYRASPNTTPTTTMTPTPSRGNSPPATSASRDLRRLPKPFGRHSTARDRNTRPTAHEGAIALLADTPRPPNATRLVGVGDRWRIRIGDYRVIYSIEDGRLRILVIRIAHRREVHH